MKSNYHERRQARQERYENLAVKNTEKSATLCDDSIKMIGALPAGQPILVGHHSEKRHRKYLVTADNKMRQSVEAEKKAAYYKDKAEALLKNTAISSDDPDALDKLKEKLQSLEDTQELYKAINKILRTKKSDAEKVTSLQNIGIKESTAIKLVTPDRTYGTGIPRFQLTNNNANIRRIRQRITYLEKISAMPSSEEEINGVRLVVSSEDNRIQLYFPGKPSDEVRTALKRAGFRWAPSIGAWMRQISGYAIQQAKEILKEKVS